MNTLLVGWRCGVVGKIFIQTKCNNISVVFDSFYPKKLLYDEASNMLH